MSTQAQTTASDHQATLAVAGAIRCAASSVAALRKVDVLRVLSEAGNFRALAAQTITDHRPDLAEEVAEVMAEEFGSPAA